MGYLPFDPGYVHFVPRKNWNYFRRFVSWSRYYDREYSSVSGKNTNKIYEGQSAHSPVPSLSTLYDRTLLDFLKLSINSTLVSAIYREVIVSYLASQSAEAAPRNLFKLCCLHMFVP